MHYKPTEQYRAHFDFLGEGEADGGGADGGADANGGAGASGVAGGGGRGHRLVTVFVYLQPPKQGGRTRFPELGQSFQPGTGGGVHAAPGGSRVETCPHHTPAQASQRALRRAAVPQRSYGTTSTAPADPTRSRCTRASLSSAGRSGA